MYTLTIQILSMFIWMAYVALASYILLTSKDRFIYTILFTQDPLKYCIGLVSRIQLCLAIEGPEFEWLLFSKKIVRNRATFILFLYSFYFIRSAKSLQSADQNWGWERRKSKILLLTFFSNWIQFQKVIQSITRSIGCKA